MPIHEYKCRTCSQTFERIEISSNMEPPDRCPLCGASGLDRLMSSGSFTIDGQFAAKKPTGGRAF